MPRVVHFEFPVDNPARAVDFFSKVFGWEFQRWGEEEYYLTTGGPQDQPGIGGAIMKKNDPQHPVTTTIGVDSIDEAIVSIEQNGGVVVVPKQPVGDMGFLAYFRDPEGVIHGLWEVTNQG